MPEAGKRRAILALAFMVLLALEALVGSGRTQAEIPPSTAHAFAALDALLLRFRGDLGNGLLATYPPDGSHAQYWLKAQALDAILDGAELPGGEKYRAPFLALLEAQRRQGLRRDFYDDENWMVLVLLRAFDATGNRSYLADAEALYGDIMTAWDSGCCGSAPGGIWWDRAHTQKATASNAGPVISGVRLAARTGDARYLEFARRAYAFWSGQFVDPPTGAVADHVDRSGAIVWWRFTYNEGLMVGGSLELFRATGEVNFLREAEEYARRMVKDETTATPLGPVLTDGTNDECLGDCAQFKGIAYRYLQALESVDPRPEYEAVLRASAEAIWTLALNTMTGLFSTDWAGPAVGAGTLAQQTSAAMALARFAAMDAAVHPRAPSVKTQEVHSPATGELAMQSTGRRTSWTIILILQLTLMGLVVALPFVLPFQTAVYVFLILIPLGFLVPYLWWKRQAAGPSNKTAPRKGRR